MTKVNGVKITQPLFGPDGNPVTGRTLDPEEVSKRVRKRPAHEYEEASKRLFIMAEFFQKSNMPKNIVDDVVKGAVLLGEVYVAKREGIIKNA
jgi:hypothetical protein